MINWNDDLLYAVTRNAIRRLSSHLVRKCGLEGEKGMPGTPNYVFVRLYAQDARIRTLLSCSLNSPNLILMAEWFSSWRKNVGPVLVKQPDAIVDRILIRHGRGFSDLVANGAKSGDTGLTRIDEGNHE